MPWWEVYTEDRSLVRIDDGTARLADKWSEDVWSDLEPWWGSYVERQREEARELYQYLDRLGELWINSECSFDTDPLTVDWTSDRDIRGPLRPNQEENWSRWLADVLRTAPDRLGIELFGEAFEGEPTNVRCEEYLPATLSSEPYRYADILCIFSRNGISIEVKKGDENYEKTTHTARLIEEKHSRYDWDHFLLLPKKKMYALRQSFKDDLEDTADRTILESGRSGPISVIYWQDISASIRNTLLHGEAPNQHWEASAYLLCTLIEQKILGYIPQPKVATISTASTVLLTPTLTNVTEGVIEDQIQYLRKIEVNKDE